MGFILEVQNHLRYSDEERDIICSVGDRVVCEAGGKRYIGRIASIGNYSGTPSSSNAFSCWGHNSICTNLVIMMAFVTCPFFVFQQKNPQNTQERHPQKEG